jgi:S-adenosylmethionine uptake transporter
MAPSMPRSIALPFLAACVGIALFSVMDGAMKAVSIAVGAYNAMLWRQATGIFIGGPMFFATRNPWPRRDVMRLHFRRGVIGAVMAFTFFWGIARVPLAEGIALSFIAPLIALYLAAVLLGEKIAPRAIFASVMGIVGVGVILAGRIGNGTYDEEAVWGAGSILVSAAFYGYNLILQRQQAQVANPIEIAFFLNLFALITVSLAAPWFAEPLPREQWPMILFASGLAYVSILLLSWAYARAEAQVLLPVEYTAFVWAAVIGFLWFEETLTLATVAGTGLIVAGCIVAARQKPGPPEHVEATAV